MRVKRGVTKRAKHKKTLELAKGYRMTYSSSYRRAMEAVRHAGQYSYNHRKRRGSQMRQEWIKVIAAKLSGTQMSYSKFINSLKVNNIEIDRKNLAEMIIYNESHFDNLFEKLK